MVIDINVKNKVYLYENFGDIKPWLTKDAVNFLEKKLNKNSICFEWVSGRSATWFAKKVKYLISVENNIKWYKKVKVMLENRRLDNVRYLFFNEDERKDNPKISNYASAINEYNDEIFDFILVDGIFREYCALNSIPKLKKGGFLIVDNIQWFLPSFIKCQSLKGTDEKPITENWKNLKKLREGEIIWTTNGINDTGIFIKPI